MKKLNQFVPSLIVAGVLALIPFTGAKADPKIEHSVAILLSDAYGGETHVYIASTAGPAPEIRVGQTTAQAVKALLDAGFKKDGGDWFSAMFVR